MEVFCNPDHMDVMPLTIHGFWVWAIPRQSLSGQTLPGRRRIINLPVWVCIIFKCFGNMRFTEIEMHVLQKQIDGSDSEISNNAAEIIIHTDTLSEKLKDLHLNQWCEDCGYPEYAELLETYKKYPPFYK